MKSFLIAVAVLVLGDFAINHGNGTDALIHAVRSFFEWVAHVGDQSIFTQ